MKTYIFDIDEPKNRTVNARNPFTKRIKRIAHFKDGEFRTNNPNIFLKMRKKFPNYRIEYDEPKQNYNLIQRNNLITMASQRGYKDVLTMKKKDIVSLLEKDDAQKNKKEV